MDRTEAIHLRRQGVRGPVLPDLCQKKTVFFSGTPASVDQGYARLIWETTISLRGTLLILYRQGGTSQTLCSASSRICTILKITNNHAAKGKSKIGQGAAGGPTTGVLTGEAIPTNVTIVKGPLPFGAPGPPFDTQIFPAASIAIPAGPAIW